MSYLHCPYCEVKENAKIKTVYKALQPINGKCPDCGAWIDVGQHSIEIDGYADIYKGALNLIDDVVRQVNDILSYLDIETTEIEGNTPCVRLSPNEIVRTLFAPYVGGTSTHNLKNALGIEDDELAWEVKAEQYEW